MLVYCLDTTRFLKALKFATDPYLLSLYMIQISALYWIAVAVRGFRDDQANPALRTWSGGVCNPCTIEEEKRYNAIFFGTHSADTHWNIGISAEIRWCSAVLHR